MELCPKATGSRPPSAFWVRQCELLLALGPRLPALLRGEDAPDDPTQQLALASLAQLPRQRRYAAAARLYARAFAADPTLADDREALPRYSAARAAALAAAGRGEGAADLGEPERAGLRGQARDWLRAELSVCAKQVRRGPGGRALARPVLQDWRVDPALAGVRDPEALARLPEAERRAWQQLWRDLDALLEQAAEPAGS